MPKINNDIFVKNKMDDRWKDAYVGGKPNE